MSPSPEVVRAAPASFEAAQKQYNAFLWQRVYHWQSRNPQVEESDLLQEGLIALHEALASYDVEKGAGFLSWLAWGVNVRMRRHCIRMARTVRVPDAKFGRVPVHCVSLNVPLHEDGAAEIIDALPQPEPERREAEHDLKTALAAAVEKLTPQQRRVIHLYFFEGLSLRAIAARLGVTMQAVFMRKRDALSKLAQSRILRKEAA